MKKILSIDDSKSVHAFLDRCFENSGYQLMHYLDPIEALKMLESNKNKFDLILLDWEMPGMVGPDVLKNLRQKGISTPVIMLTSKNEVEDITTGLTLGAQEYVMKPFTPDIIIEKVSSILSLSAA